MFKDKRRAIRVKVNLDAEIYDENENYLSNVKIVDLSVGGAKIITTISTQDPHLTGLIGKTVLLKFFLKKITYIKTSIGKEIKVKFKLLRKENKNKFGGMFVELDTLTKERIRDYIEYKLKGGL